MNRATKHFFRKQIDVLLEKIEEIENVRNLEEKELSFSLKDFSSSFEKMSDSLNELILPFGLFSVNESVYICEGEEREDFEKSFETFKTSYKQTLMYCKAFVSCSKPVATDEDKKKSFIYRLDANIKATVDNFNDMISTKDPEKFDDIKRIESAYFAYLAIARAINTAIIQYNEEFPNYKLETLQNIPEPKFLDSADDLKDFFDNWLQSAKT